MLQDVGRKYVRIINTIHGRTGTLWEGRFKSSLIDSETYLFTCHKYIELNPLRAGIASRPSEYRWSSHAHYAFGRHDPLVTEHGAYAALGPTAVERRSAFLALFATHLDPSALGAIRAATQAGAALGSQTFLERIARAVGRPVETPRRGRPRKEGDPAPVRMTGKLF